MYRSRQDATRRFYCAVGLWATILTGQGGVGQTQQAALGYQEIAWNNSLGGAYSDATNWEPAVVPGAEEIGVFDLGAADPYQVYLEFQESWTTAGLEVRSDKVWLNLNAGQLELPGAWWGYSLLVGKGTGEEGWLEISGGVLEGWHAAIGWGIGATGQLRLADGVRINLSGELTVGSNGQGTCQILGASQVRAYGMFVGRNGSEEGGGEGNLEVREGGQVISRSNAAIGVESKSRGWVTVSGAGSAWLVRDETDWRELCVGWAGEGGMTVEEGGLVETGVGLTGAQSSGKGTIVVRKAGHFYVDGYFQLGGEGQGRLEVVEGGWAEAGYCTMAEQPGSAAEAVVSGAGSVWETWNWAVADNLVIGRAGEAQVNVREGGRVRTELDIVVGDLSGATGRLRVTSSGAEESQVSCRDLTIGREAGASGLVEVGGGRVQVRRTLTVGQEGTGILDVRDPEGQWGGPGIVTVGEFDPEMEFQAGTVTVGPEGFLRGQGLIRGTVVCLGMFVQPGGSPGVLRIEGQYVQEWPGNLLIPIAGTQAGESYSQLEVFGPGDVTIRGGALVLAFENYLPKAGDVFDIIRFSGILTPASDWFDTIWIWGLGPVGSGEGIWDYHLELIGNGTGNGVLRVVSDSTVPEAVSGLLAAGLAGMGLIRRQKN